MFILLVLKLLFLFLLLPFFILNSIIRVVWPPDKKCVKNKIVLITGAANGLGRGLAKKFAKLGSVLVLVDMKKLDLEETEKIIQSENNGKAVVHTYVCDISDRENVYKMAQYVLKKLGKIDIVINNAALIYSSTFTDGKDEDIQRVINVNILGQIWMTKAFLPSMQERNEGQIVFISSVTCTIHLKGMNIYCMTKAAISGLVMSLKDELETNSKWNKIVVTAIHPSFMETNPLVKEAVRMQLPIIDLDASVDYTVTAIRRNPFLSAVPGYELGVSFLYFIRCLPQDFQRLIMQCFDIHFGKVNRPELMTRYMSNESVVSLTNEFGLGNLASFFTYEKQNLQN